MQKVFQCDKEVGAEGMQQADVRASAMFAYVQNQLLQQQQHAQPANAAISGSRMRPVVKVEVEQALQEDAGTERARRRRMNDAGDAEPVEAKLLRERLEAQALTLQATERARALEAELEQANARISELTAELESKHSQLQAKDKLLKARDDEILHLRNDGALCVAVSAADTMSAAAADVAQPAPARCAAAASAALDAESLFMNGTLMYGEQLFAIAADSWLQAAQLKHGESHACLADMLIEGRPGMAKDEAQAFNLAGAGAALGCPHSMGVLGRCYAYGRGVAADASRAVALAQASAAKESRFGQYVLGACYRDGKGVEQSDKEAVRWLRLATEQWHGAAQCKLGYMFDVGQGVKQDHEQAGFLYQLAAHQGIALAQHNVGVCYENGRGLSQDMTEAVRCYRLAAAQGDELAISALKRLGV
jgi:TPR repeat protein